MCPASHRSSPQVAAKGAGVLPAAVRRNRPLPSPDGSGQAGVSLPPRTDRPVPLEDPALAPARSVVRYRGFVLLPQPDLGWLVRPERSPMTILPFRTPPLNLSEAKALIDARLNGWREPQSPVLRQGTLVDPARRGLGDRGLREGRRPRPAEASRLRSA